MKKPEIKLDNPCFGCFDEVPCETCVAKKNYDTKLSIISERDKQWVKLLKTKP